MVATYTLNTTTFAAPVLVADTLVNLSSVANVRPGMFLFSARELMRVDRLAGVGTNVIVLRGQGGTSTRVHTPLFETVYIAEGFQLFDTDPEGVPPVGVRSNPHINVQNGNVWVVQGDEVGDGTQDRSWQLVTRTQLIGALGVRQYSVTTPT